MYFQKSPGQGKRDNEIINNQKQQQQNNTIILDNDKHMKNFRALNGSVC